MNCHADVVGGINLLRRSQDEQVGLDDHPKVVRELLRARYLSRRNPGKDSSAGLCRKAPAPVPSGRRLTTGASPPRRERHSLKSDAYF